MSQTEKIRKKIIQTVNRRHHNKSKQQAMMWEELQCGKPKLP
jgi:hypothetical protein